jgi:Transcriptional regulator, AbiEi antitoxin, Type IV TA system/Transcriptional regulator, AbiEi antitoxin N-terminal domain
MQENTNLNVVCRSSTLPTMATPNRASINQLERALPEGLLVDAAWLARHGYSTSLRSKYVASGWLTQPARRLYQRPRGDLSWQQVVISLQTLLAQDLVVGGRSALALHGHEHYLRQSNDTTYLYGPKRPPTWLPNLKIGTEFRCRNDGRIFTDAIASTAPHRLQVEDRSRAKRSDGTTSLAWGQWNWPLTVSTPERAIIELLDELPEDETFHQVDVLMEGLSTLSPTRLQALLVDCHNVKVKRLFFFFADRHAHAWLKRLDRKAIDLGRGKRSLVKGGRYDAKYMITVPEDLDATG